MIYDVASMPRHLHLSRKLVTANKYYENAFARDGKELILMVSDKADVIKEIFLHAPSHFCEL